MGTQTTHTPPPPSFACLSLHCDNVLRLTDFPAAATSWIQQAATDAWPRGVTSITPTNDGTVRIQLNGSPWSAKRASDAVQSCRLMLAILRRLMQAGYLLVGTTDVDCAADSKDMLLFEAHGDVDVSPRLCSIAMSQHDILRVIDAPPALLDTLRTLLQDYVVPSSSSPTSPTAQGGVAQFKLGYSPWGIGAKSTGRFVVLKLLALLRAHGWHLYGSIRHCYEADKSGKDTWYLTYEANSHACIATNPTATTRQVAM
ncbi:Aste57867_9185 [Aphanomyces stellatus]|uniref:Aste57867_9185 protein n=1 Tax=Aphanomyces stellatus TaxID=120398 RepID=A0A485KM54_9STRA|nr:hypothetical protein As57867_009149 [Aphanomyces stellatus]VFT86068.1 Aste57867_9185 [Aphanomyces stellatus]